MRKGSITKFAVILISLVFAFSVNTHAQKTDCTKVTDAELVESIYAKLKVKYESQLNHINVRAKDGVVTIEGWATTSKVKKDIIKIAKKVKCVKKVEDLLTIGVGGGCGPGQKPCGDICIPNTETCNIRTKG